MKNLLLTLSAFIHICLFSQGIDFIKLDPLTFDHIENNLIDLNESSMATGDIDGDGDLDLVINGYSTINSSINTLVYLNDSLGNFIHLPNPEIIHLSDGGIDLGDIDGDGDLDLIVTGYNYNFNYKTQLLINDGSGLFSEVSLLSIPDINNGDVTFLDYDNDGDQDLIITGGSASGYVSNAYLNDGFGVFTLDNSITFEALRYSQIELGDYNNDSFTDLIIAGRNTLGDYRGYVYLSNGVDGFDWVDDFPAGMDLCITHGDMDGDLDEDMMISYYSTFSSASYLGVYANDGNGNFIFSTNYPGVRNGELELLDFDSDSDLDVVIGGEEFFKVYENDGLGTLIEFLSSGLQHTPPENTFVVIDINDDTIKDIVSISESSNIYMGDGNSSFLRINNSLPLALNNPSSAYGDVDGDGDLDVVMIGQDEMEVPRCELLLNDGTGHYTFSGVTFDGVYRGDIELADLDNDGDLDIFYSGSIDLSNVESYLYLNDGSGQFSYINSGILGAGKFSSIEIKDFNSDGNKDIFISGGNVTNADIFSMLYLNTGSAIFTPTTTSVSGCQFSSSVSGDIDGNGTIDLILCGDTGGNYSTDLYLNDGNGTFTIQALNLTDISRGNLELADLDNDADLDLFIVGQGLGLTYVADIFLNDGQGNFDAQSNSILGLHWSDSKFIDLDNDNDLDLIMTGWDELGFRSTFVYRRDIYGDYQLDNNITGLVGYVGEISIVDVNGDNNDDLIISAMNDDLNQNTLIFEWDYVPLCAANYTWEEDLTQTNTVLVTDVSSGSSSLNYLWNFGDGNSSLSNTPTHTYSGLGPYEVCLIIEDQSFCSSNFCDSISVSNKKAGLTINVISGATIDLKEETVNQLAVYPNPNNGGLHIDLEKFDSPVKYILTDLNGRMILSGKLKQQNNFIDIQVLQSGTYLIQIEGMSSIRIIKQ